GTADRLLDRVRQQLQRPGALPLRYLLLDFRRVTGIDSTALLSFRRIRRLAETHNLTVVLTDVSPAIQRQLGEEAAGPAVRLFPDMDHGCEWCEEQLLASLEGAVEPGNPLRQELTRILGYEEIVDGLLSYAERREIATGDYLIRQGDPPDALDFIEFGRLTSQLET